MSESAPAKIFDIKLPTFSLEGGSQMHRHVVRGWWWGPKVDEPWLDSKVVSVSGFRGYGVVHRTDADHMQLAQEQDRNQGGVNVSPPEHIPTVLVVHALTGDMRVGGEGGWWPDLIADGGVLDPAKHRILCFNNLGSCYGTSGPDDWEAKKDTTKGEDQHGNAYRGGALSTWDQARSILLALDHLGIQKVRTVIGGSVGGAIALCLAALAPKRFETVVAIATAEASSPWVIGWNHIARQMILMDPGYPDKPERGLSLARQLAHLTYRNESGLLHRHGRGFAYETIERFDSGMSFDPSYRMQAYLEHQGGKLVQRYDVNSYLSLLDAMDHHDLARCPGKPGKNESWTVHDGCCEGSEAIADMDLYSPSASFGLSRIRARVYALSVNSDQLYFSVHSVTLCDRFRELGGTAHFREISSVHGHDGFLLEIDQLAPVLREALED